MILLKKMCIVSLVKQFLIIQILVINKDIFAMDVIRDFTKIRLTIAINVNLIFVTNALKNFYSLK